MSEKPEKETVSNSGGTFLSVDIARFALDSANVGIWILDAKTREFLPSDRTKALFGFSPEEDMSFEDALRNVVLENRSTVTTAVESAIKNHSSLYIECPVVIPPEKKHRWLSITGGFS